VNKVASWGPTIRHLAGRSGVLHAVSGDGTKVWPLPGRQTVNVQEKSTVDYQSAADRKRAAKKKWHKW
jgi:hypothetical protein